VPWPDGAEFIVVVRPQGVSAGLAMPPITGSRVGPMREGGCAETGVVSSACEADVGSPCEWPAVSGGVQIKEG